MSLPRGVMVVGGLTTYAGAVFVGFQLTKKPHQQTTGSEYVSIDPKNIQLEDHKRLASFDKKSTVYDNGMYHVIISHQGIY